MSNARKLADNLPIDGQLGNRNVLINGAMNVAQRSVSVTGLGATTGYYTADRWKHDFGNTSGRLTSSVVGITDLAGFRSALKFACTTADTSIAANELFVLNQPVEGFNIQSVGFGTASAKPLTLSFYAKGNGNAQYTAQLQTGGSNEISASFNVTSSWQRFEINFPAATSVGSVLDNNNTTQLFVQFWLVAGSTYSGGTSLNTTWGSPNNNTMAVGTDNFFSSTSNEFFITGCQLEVGSQSTPFEHEPVGVTLSKCQRYYYRWKVDAAGGTYNFWNTGYAYQANGINIVGQLPVNMRASPTFSTAGNFRCCSDQCVTVSSITLSRANTKTPSIVPAVSGAVAGQAYALGDNNDSSAYLGFDAEL